MNRPKQQNQLQQRRSLPLSSPIKEAKGRFFQSCAICVVLHRDHTARTTNSTEQHFVDFPLCVCVFVLQVGCGPLSDQDELHLSVLEKHVSLLLRKKQPGSSYGALQLINTLWHGVLPKKKKQHTCVCSAVLGNQETLVVKQVLTTICTSLDVIFYSLTIVCGIDTHQFYICIVLRIQILCIMLNR